MNDPIQSLYFGDTGQVIAARGNAYIGTCPGREQCPYDRQEEEEQARFEQSTGIACCKGARQALRHLLAEANCEISQLRLAWRTSSIVWDADTHRLLARPSRLEEAYGLLIFSAALLFVIAFVVLFFVLAPERLNSREAWVMGVQLLAFTAVMPLAAINLVRPNRIARRIAPYLERYYQQT